MTKNFYHLFANGDDAKDFITTEQEFKSAFNRFGVCAYLADVVVVSFSIEDSHPHGLLFGTLETCCRFRDLYKSMTIKSIARHRGNADGVRLNFELDMVTDSNYLMNVATYTIVQPTKDGKSVMPYDYLYGTGAMYFRSRNAVLPWMVDNDGKVSDPARLGDLTIRERLKICGSNTTLPSDWLVCNGFILPSNYVDVQRFEGIYRTHNCYRVYLCSNKQKDAVVLNRMSEVRGVKYEDLEARRICSETCQELFSKASTRHLNIEERLRLAQTLRRKYRFSIRQLSFLVHLPETELEKYV